MKKILLIILLVAVMLNLIMVLFNMENKAISSVVMVGMVLFILDQFRGDKK
ncbi:hypothetical protein HBP98_00730 [Listeria booriae]|uniref:Uncharacterized protein n=1 Tax=Listeria booriae TaxID=1552123 RepID=A0A7X1A3D3_9LIST|nr:hypothetical protein [Listeria booriae]MBC2370517.1 hypothetical protein [Listeria booriae]